MKTLYLSVLLCIFTNYVYAQTDTLYRGIKWTHGLTWEQVKQKASNEDKYIFLDCFATWCGPCKEMDKYVYTNDTVGKYFNDRFISVKVQMDRTKNDDEQVKSWYKSAESISSQYKITGYPSFVFLSPSGEVVNKEEGFKSVKELKTIAKTAMDPTYRYQDPFADYDNLVQNYRNGLKTYSRIPYMIEQAKKIRNTKLTDSLVKDYYSYLDNLKKRKLFTQTNIGFIASNLKSSQDKYFHLFYPNGRKVDALMGKHGYSRAAVYKVIQTEDIDPFMNRFIKSNSMKTVQAGAAPNWKTLVDSIAYKYNLDYADWAVRMAKQDFFWKTGNKPGFVQTVMVQIQKYDYDTTNMVERYGMMNVCSWMIFESSNNKDTINIAIHWMEEVLRSEVFVESPFLLYDTYGNLLYKTSMLHGVNRFNEAIQWEEKAVQGAIDEEGVEVAKQFQDYVDKMKKREPTW